MGLGHLERSGNMSEKSHTFQVLSLIRGPGLQEIDVQAEILFARISATFFKLYDSGDVCYRIQIDNSMTGDELQELFQRHSLQERRYRISPIDLQNFSEMENVRFYRRRNI